MTGFASFSSEDPLVSLGVTIRSLNHRHLDLQLRVAPALAALEPRLRSQVQRTVSRGRVELAISAQFKQPPEVTVDLNERIVRAMADALERARACGLRIGEVTAGDLMRVPHALTIRECIGQAEGATEAQVADATCDAVDRALTELDGMRVREGEFLRADLDARREALGTLVERVAAAAEMGRAAMEARLTARVEQLAVEPQPDPALLVQEVVRVAARSDISEEVTRLRGHLRHWNEIVDAPGACGRKLDFLLQEMNREVNTIGAKAEGPGVSEIIVSAKAELERLREQVQNVE